MQQQQQQQQSPQSDSMMYEEDNKALVRSFVEVFNEHNMSAVDKYYMHKILYNTIHR
jgi:hypothetical protein